MAAHKQPRFKLKAKCLDRILQEQNINMKTLDKSEHFPYTSRTVCRAFKAGEVTPELAVALQGYLGVSMEEFVEI